MKSFKFLLSLLLLWVSANCFAVAIEEGMSPVNTISETGKDVGACRDGGALDYAPQNYKGIAYFVPKNDPAFASAHAVLTKSEQKWVKEMSGPSAQNRLYVDKAGNRVLVLMYCKQGDCGAHSAYATYNISTQDYGIELIEIGKHRTLGSIPSTSRAALACASMIDQRLRAETEAKLFGKRKGAGK